MKSLLLILLMPVLMFSTEAKDADDYEYLIVTTDALKDVYGDFIEFNKRRCLRTQVQTIDYIKANMTGVDDADKLRNYIKQEFTDHNIVYVLLGGDDDNNNDNDIPHRGFRAQCYDNVALPDNFYQDNNIPADMYYSCLDGDWKDSNQYYGEPGSEDLMWEVYASRFAVDNETELNNMINKTIKYSEDPVVNEVKNCLLTGETPWSSVVPPPPPVGKDYMEQLRGECSANGYTTVGFGTNWNISTLYEVDQPWNKATFISSVRDDKITWINNIGAANYGIVLKNYIPDVNITNYTNDGTNANFFIIYTQGSYPNGFTENNCIGEQFTAGIPNGAVAFIGNARRGFHDDGSQGSSGTDGSNQRLHRYFHDAIFDKGIHYLAMMNAYSKEVNAQYIMEPDITQRPYPGTMRFVAYGLNVLGDPALSVWTETPQKLQADHPSYFTGVQFEWDTKKPYTWVALLTQDGVDIITSQLTGEDGKCLIDDNALEDAILSGNYYYLKINVKAHNYLPYQGEIQISNPEINESLVNIFKDSKITIFSRTGTIEYHLTTSGFITISIFNSRGKSVKTIVNENQRAGKHTVTFRSDNVSNGIYYIKFSINDNAVVRKAVIIK